MVEDLDANEILMGKYCVVAAVSHVISASWVRPGYGNAAFGCRSSKRINMEPDRTYILCEETRERMTSLMISVMNSQKVG